jgi:hypothetical protein
MARIQPAEGSACIGRRTFARDEIQEGDNQ